MAGEPVFSAPRRGIERALADSDLTPKERLAVRAALATLGFVASADIVVLSGGDLYRVRNVGDPKSTPEAPADAGCFARERVQLVVVDDEDAERPRCVLEFLGYDAAALLAGETEAFDAIVGRIEALAPRVVLIGKRLGKRLGAELVEALRRDKIATVALGAPISADLELGFPLRTSRLAPAIDGLLEKARTAPRVSTSG